MRKSEKQAEEKKTMFTFANQSTSGLAFVIVIRLYIHIFFFIRFASAFYWRVQVNYDSDWYWMRINTSCMTIYSKYGLTMGRWSLLHVKYLWNGYWIWPCARDILYFVHWQMILSVEIILQFVINKSIEWNNINFLLLLKRKCCF